MPGVALADGPAAPPAEVVAAQVNAEQPAANQATEAELSLFNLVNHDRAEAGLPPVELDPELLWVARARAADQVPLPALSHKDGAGRLVFADLLAQGQTRFRLAGENLARLGADGDAPGRADEALMHSPTHRANILEPSFNRLAIGAAEDSNGRIIFAQIFRAA
jgi:uncharacterized protein YkwD